MTNRQIFLHHIAQTSDAPIGIEADRAEGLYIYDTEGKPYIDLISGIGVSCLGHCYPAVVKAVQDQAATYMHLMVYGEYVQSPQTELAALLAQQLTESLNCVYFTNSGSEATEGALKLAKRKTGRTELISFKDAYHGSTHGALSIMGDEFFKSNFRPLLPDCRQVNFNSVEDLKLITSKTAAVMVEPIQAEAGIRLPKAGYLEKLRARCTEVGALLIFDEVQTGYGRTGKLFAHQHYNVIPDIITLAKGFGGGMPLGAFLSSRNIMNCLSDNPILGHITTYGGHPVSCAAGVATLKELLTTPLIADVPAKEALFVKLLQHSKIIDMRHKGLLMCLELDSMESVLTVCRKCLELGLITDWFLFASNCVRIAPPLTITINEIEKSCAILLKALDTL